ncbi:temptin-like [Littorina saxatilis]|uniref:Temptin Cys/Cys disulfide domain-containing protein n=1 Tax=Littorina saxatilis TaxID=31220 RepID=A0AAN9GMT3_9CAEN
MRTEQLLCLATMVAGALGFSEFTSQIPNAARVPQPCNDHAMWAGVGHLAMEGAGPTNVFGQDFNELGNRWTSDVCTRDSDGDGRTNGEELGDPDCTWTPGAEPNSTRDITHPGICDPANSTMCQQKAVPQSGGVTFTTQQDWLLSVCGTSTSSTNGQIRPVTLTSPQTHDNSGGPGMVTSLNHATILMSFICYLIFTLI